MMSDRILITGAAGFIGSNLVDKLLEEGRYVLGIDNFDPFYDRAIKEKNISNALTNDNFLFRTGDIRDSVFLNKCISEFCPDVIVHLAAKAGVRRSILDPQSYFDVNLTGTLNLLEAMRQNLVGKLIFASSSSVYGNNKKIPFSESDSVDYPVSPYAASKKAGELLCHTYHHLFGFNIFCLRFFTVYGPRQRPDLAINKFTTAMLRGAPVTLFGDGSTSRDYTYIDDILQGILASIKNLSGFEIFNLGESSAITLNDLVALIEKITMLKAERIIKPFQDGDVNQTYADISKAKKLLGYNPVTDIETGLRNYFDWFKSAYLTAI